MPDDRDPYAFDSVDWPGVLAGIAVAIAMALLVVISLFGVPPISGDEAGR